MIDIDTSKKVLSQVTLRDEIYYLGIFECYKLPRELFSWNFLDPNGVFRQW